MKANNRFSKGASSHAMSGEYKIPFKDRKAFMGSNDAKWVSEKEFLKYLKWKKAGRK